MPERLPDVNPLRPDEDGIRRRILRAIRDGRGDLAKALSAELSFRVGLRRRRQEIFVSDGPVAARRYTREEHRRRGR